MVLKSVREEQPVTEALQRASIIYPRVWDAYEALCWVLGHRQPSGASLQGSGELYHLHKQAAGGFGVPSLTLIYTISDDVVAIHTIKVG